MTEALALSRLLQLCSPALPVGAYAYSQALESAIAEDLVTDEQKAADWISGVFRHSIAGLDVPAMLLAYRDCLAGQGNRVPVLDRYLGASRESRELLLEDKEMGRALARLLRSLDVSVPDVSEPSFATMFGCAGAAWHISEAILATGFCFSWLENQVGIATKTVPLGQTASQQILARLSQDIEPAMALARQVADDVDMDDPGSWDFGNTLPVIAVLSARHENLESRLYRS